MVKGIEKYGIPVVHIATVVPISKTIGANRMIPAIGIPYPLGDVTQSPEDSYRIRENLCRRALKALQTPVTEQTVFEKDNF
jgi:glycine reductase